MWYPFLGWGVFWIGLIVAIILYALKKKWYPILYLISVCLYIFTIGFIIDIYSFGTNGTLGMLALSALIMIGIGWYLSKKVKELKR